MSDFKGFGKNALPFFKALKFHQSKEWFDENRKLYEDDVVAPMVALLDDLTEAFARKKVALRADGKRSIFRIHRDVRFAKDKSPYKSHAGAVMTRSGGKNDPGLLYIHISPEGCFVAAGFHVPEPSALAKLRKAIKAKPAQFEKLMAGLEKASLPLGRENILTRAPRGFEEFKEGPLSVAVRLRSFIVEEPLLDKSIASPKLSETVVDFAVRALPLLTFGWAALD
jgi:uncharacterized protein (TIGR02453 family)